MKKLLLSLAVIASLSFISSATGLTQKERDASAKFLQDTEDGVLSSMKGLS